MKARRILITTVFVLVVFVALSLTTSAHGEVAFVYDNIRGVELLGTLGGAHSYARAINDSGQVAGTAFTEESVHAFIWDVSLGMRDIGTLDSYGVSFAYAINNSGQVAGSDYYAGGQGHAFVWDSINGMGYLETTYKHSVALGINSSGQIVGLFYDDFDSRHAFIWDATGGMQDLGVHGGIWSIAAAINDLGQVTGAFATESGGYRAFLWDPTNGYQDILGNLGEMHNSWGHGINDSGQVVGSFDTPSGHSHAFVWDATSGMQDLGTLGGTYSGAMDINNNGEVVGWYHDGQHKSFVWDIVHGMQDLGTLGQEYVDVRRINVGGQIVGHLIVAEIPEPATLSVLALGGLAILRRRRSC